MKAEHQEEISKLTFTWLTAVKTDLMVVVQ